MRHNAATPLALTGVSYVVLSVLFSAVIGYMAWEMWGEGRWAMAGIYTLSAVAFLASTALLSYHLAALAGRER